MRYLIVATILLLFSCQSSVQKTIRPAKIPIKVVILSMFEPGNDEADRPGEFQYWVEKLPLKDTIPFDYGFDRNLRYNKELGVLGMVTGIGNTQAGISVMASCNSTSKGSPVDSIASKPLCFSTLYNLL